MCRAQCLFNLFKLSYLILTSTFEIDTSPRPRFMGRKPAQIDEAISPRENIRNVRAGFKKSDTTEKSFLNFIIMLCCLPWNNLPKTYIFNIHSFIHLFFIEVYLAYNII